MSTSKEQDKSLYYEAHITVEPVFDERLDELKKHCNVFGFRVADLLMQKRKDETAARSVYDTFATGRDTNHQNLKERTLCLVDLLEQYNFSVWRYKTEAALIDSKYDDSIRPLTKTKEISYGQSKHCGAVSLESTTTCAPQYDLKQSGDNG